MIPIHIRKRHEAQKRYTLKHKFLRGLLSTRKGIATLQKKITEATRKLAKRLPKVSKRKGSRKNRRNA